MSDLLATVVEHVDERTLRLVDANFCRLFPGRYVWVRERPCKVVAVDESARTITFAASVGAAPGDWVLA